MPRGRIISLAITFFVSGFLFFSFVSIVSADSSDIQITEIMYNPTDTDANHEWVELYNNGNEEVEIVGGSKTESWRFCDENDDSNCNHLFSTSTILLPGEYMIIAQSTSTFSKNHAEFTSKLVKSSFDDLHNTQDTVALRIGTNGVLWSKVGYLSSWGGNGNGKSLEKKNLTGDDSAMNWQESASAGGTPGMTNSTGASQPPSSPISPATPPEIPPLSPTSSTGSAGSSSPISCQNTILVNEIMINPEDSNADYEFVELYNQTDIEKDISGWILEDSQGKTTKFTLPANAKIASHNFLTLYRPQTKITLNNSGDGMKLSNASGQICDASPHNSGAADEDASYSRKNANWVWTAASTPNATNVFTEAKSGAADSSNQKTNDSTSFTSTSAPAPINASSTILLNEFMPNPKGVDTEKEFIELKNISAMTVKLDKWRLEDSSRKKFVFSSSTIINAGEFLIVWSKDSNISLNNSNDAIKLFNPDGQIADQINFNEPAEDNFSYNRVSASSSLWKWSTVPSPGVENFVSEPNHPPTIIFSIPNVAEIGEEIFFDASNSADPEEDSLSFVWNFGDKTEAIGATSTHQYTRAGKFKITLTVNDYHANEVKEKAVMTIIDNGETIENNATANSAKKNKTTAKWLRVSGVVTVPPGLFGAQYFYLQDNAGRGWQIYMFKKDFPNLKVGDRVETAGETSETQSGVRIKTKQKADIKILSGKDDVAPEELAIADIDDAGLGGLVKITGEVLEPKSGKFYIADDSGEILVELKSRAGFKGQIVKESDKVEVTGILAASKDAYKIWPRFASDIKILESKKEINGGAQSESAPTNNFLSATVGGLGSLLLAYVARGRAALAKGLAIAAISKVAFWRKNNKNLT